MTTRVKRNLRVHRFKDDHSARAGSMLPAVFRGRCLACGSETGQFDSRPHSRLCKADGCPISRVWSAAEHEKLVTVVADWATPLNIEALPSLVSDRDFDFFARWMDDPTLFPTIRPRVRCRFDPKEVAKFLPYRRDFLRDQCHQQCGNAFCYRSRRLQFWSRHKDVFVLDLSGYRWSFTLKDPRSWAAVNAAIENDVRHLAVWTAGNAGISLATLVNAANHVLAAQKRPLLRAYALYDQYDSSVDEHVRAELIRRECNLIPVTASTKAIFTPDEVRQAVQNMAVGLSDNWNLDQYWDVTDGWDADGMVMYRLLVAQVVRDLRPTHIVAPLGTGNFQLGTLMAVEDCERARVVEAGSVSVIGAIPHGENIVRQIVRRKETAPHYAPEQRDGVGGEPLMPKIATTYTPLLALIDQALENRKLRCLEVDATQQETVAAELVRPAMDRQIHAEPSSMAAFAVLPEVADDARGRPDTRILVVNSGNGLLSEKEESFLYRRRF